MRRRALRPLHPALERLASDLAPASVLADVQRAWPGVVGDVIAAQAAPVSECDGVLTVGCDAAVWASELDLMALAIVPRLNAAVGREAIRSLRCVATRANP